MLGLIQERYVLKNVGNCTWVADKQAGCCEKCSLLARTMLARHRRVGTDSLKSWASECSYHWTTTADASLGKPCNHLLPLAQVACSFLAIALLHVEAPQVI